MTNPDNLNKSKLIENVKNPGYFIVLGELEAALT